jgi:hypothetical protein
MANSAIEEKKSKYQQYLWPQRRMASANFQTKDCADTGT